MTSKQHPKSLVVASYNVRQGLGTDWVRRPGRCLAVTAEIGADIVALQEAGEQFEHWLNSTAGVRMRERTGYQPVDIDGVRPGSAWHGNMLLIRSEQTRVSGSHSISLPALEPRGAIFADIEVNALKLRVVGMHLGLLGMWRRRQARAVLGRLEVLEHQLPTVMLGDLNEWNIFGRSLRHFAKNHHVAEPGPSFPSGRRVLELDRIIASLDLSIRATGVHVSPLARCASDHLPVWARLRHVGAAARASKELAPLAVAS